MAEIQTGFGVSVITPRVGSAMVGYANRSGPYTGVHDDLHRRALVVEGEEAIWALSANEFCEITARQVARICDRVAAQVPIPPGSVHVCTVHTDSGPYDRNPEDWERLLAHLIADAIVHTYHCRVPARIGAGRGRLDGYSTNFNRRFIDRPIDPGMAVLQVEDLERGVLGLVVN